MNYHFNLNSAIFSILFLNSLIFSLPASNASVINLFDNIDASIQILKTKSNGVSCTYPEFKSLCDSTFKHQKFFHSILAADTNGVVHFQMSGIGTNSLKGVNIKKNGWFSKVLHGRTSELTEIVKVEDEKVLLKSWITADMKNGRGPSVVAVLVSLEKILTEVGTFVNEPTALLFNEQIIYENDWVNNAANVIDIPKVNGFKLAFAQSDGENNASLVAVESTRERGLFLIITGLSVLIGIGGVISFLISQKTFTKLKDDALLKLEEEHLSETEKEKIHKLAVSHVYCEVKRQVETHELENIKKQIREEFESSIRNSLIHDEENVAELHSV